jgi:plasmid stabilization system protein ParE
MSTYSAPARSARWEILDHLRTLRTNLAQARSALMHFQDDRYDRDKLEPAARRVDQLMNIFSSTIEPPEQGQVWMGEIQNGVEQVTNPKAAEALCLARVDILALLDVMRGDPAAATRI